MVGLAACTGAGWCGAGVVVGGVDIGWRGYIDGEMNNDDCEASWQMFENVLENVRKYIRNIEDIKRTRQNTRDGSSLSTFHILSLPRHQKYIRYVDVG